MILYVYVTEDDERQRPRGLSKSMPGLVSGAALPVLPAQIAAIFSSSSPSAGSPGASWPHNMLATHSIRFSSSYGDLNGRAFSTIAS